MITECKEAVNCHSDAVLILVLLFFLPVFDFAVGLLHTAAGRVWDPLFMDSGYIASFRKEKKTYVKV